MFEALLFVKKWILALRTRLYWTQCDSGTILSVDDVHSTYYGIARSTVASN